MAKVIIYGFAELEQAMRQIPPPRRVKDRMLDESAKVYRKMTKKKAETMLRGPYYKGDVAANVIIKEAEGDPNTRYITFPHDKIVHKKDADVGTIAFVNEFGAPDRGIDARQFIKAAAEDGEIEAQGVSQEIYNEYLEEIGL